MGLWSIKSGYARRVFERPSVTARLLVIAIVAAAIGYASHVYAGRIWSAVQPPPGLQGHFPYPYFHLSQVVAVALRLVSLLWFDYPLIEPLQAPAPWRLVRTISNVDAASGPPRKGWRKGWQRCKALVSSP
jgi:hypothetical protein